jgi:replicative DNA helicase
MSTKAQAKTNHNHLINEFWIKGRTMQSQFSATGSEKALLSAIIIDGLQNENPTVILKAMTELTEKDFTERKNRDMFSIMVGLSKEDKPFFDTVAITDEAAKRKVLQGTDGFMYISAVCEGAITATGCDFYISEIKKARTRRDIVAFKAKIADMPIDGFMEDAELAFFEFREKSADTGGVSTFAEITGEALNDIDKARKGGGFRGIPSGFPTIDKYTAGWQPGEVIIVAARPGMGKSVFAKDCAEAAGIPVLYFSLEMSNRELAKRHLSGLSGINFGKVKTADVSEEDVVELLKTVERYENLPIFYSDKASMSMADIRSLAMGMKIKEGIGLVIIDYLQLVKPTERLQVRQQEVADMSRQLKVLAKDLDIPVICLAQVNRECEKRGDKRPILSDLRESGAIEQDADIVAFLYREGVYNSKIDEHQAKFIIEKGRNIQTGTVSLYFDGAHQKFRSATSRDA